MKFWKLILALAVLAALLAGCAGRQTPPPPEAPPPAPAVEPEAAEPVPEEAEPEPEPEPEGQAVTLFVPDAEAMYLEETAAVLVLSPQGLMDALTAAGALPSAVTVNDFTLDGGHLLLDVSEAFREAVTASGTAGEQMLIGSVTNTLLRAYGATDLLLTCGGEPLETGHEVYDYPLEFMDLSQ